MTTETKPLVFTWTAIPDMPFRLISTYLAIDAMARNSDGDEVVHATVAVIASLTDHRQFASAARLLDLEKLGVIARVLDPSGEVVAIKPVYKAQLKCEFRKAVAL